MSATNDKRTLDFGLKAISDFMGFKLDEEVTIHQLEQDNIYCLRIIKEDATPATIYYKEKHHFFRAVGLYLQALAEGQTTFVMEEKSYIPHLGPMIDASRNSVYTVRKLKEFLVKMVLMGYNRCMLYTEDTYTLDDYPYFGYMRGRYSKEELRSLDDFADSLGIELIPCIQTLAHLRLTLKWNYAMEIKDTDDVLLVGNEDTYKFIEAMFASVKDTFRSSNIHIGMDEAFDLGRGRGFTEYGHKHHSALMSAHLQRVCELAKKYELKPMLWDDMFMRGLSTSSDQYALDTSFSQDFIDSIPPEISFVYWDYYHADRAFYEKSIDRRGAFNNPIIFAGGIWKWTGFAPHYGKTMTTVDASLIACKEKGITQVFATMWGDDGDEAPLDVTLLGLIYFSEHCYHETVDMDYLEKRCTFLTKLSINDFMSLENIDLIPGVKKPNLDNLNPSKYFLYQDILLGAFDKYIEDTDLSEYYLNLSHHYLEVSKKTPDYHDLFVYYSELSLVLSMKASIGVRLRKAYLEKDEETLVNIARIILPELKASIASFNQALRKLWLTDCKGHGLEVLDIRLSGVAGRCDTAIYRINQYLNKEIDAIEELDEERLPFKLRHINDENLPSCNLYLNIATQNTLSMFA